MLDFPEIQALEDAFQNYMTSGIEDLLPNFADMIKQGGIDTGNLLTSAAPLSLGIIPPDVLHQVYSSGAAQALQSGGGSQFLESGDARQLGLTSLQLMQQGAGLLGEAGNAAQRWTGLATGTMLNPSSQLYSPSWFSDFMAQQRASKQATQQYQYNVAAAPDPAWADRAKMFANIVGMATGAGAGGMMGGGGGLGGAIGQSYASSFGAAGGAGAAGGPSGMMAAGMMGGYPYAGQDFGYGQNLGQPQGNFFSNFGNAWGSTDPNFQTQGLGGAFGGWLGGLFNAG